MTNIIAVSALGLAVVLQSMALWIAIAVWILWILAPKLGLRRKPLLLAAVLLTIWVAALYLFFGTAGSIVGGTEAPLEVSN